MQENAASQELSVDAAKAQDALDILNEAFAYYTPEPRVVSEAPAYDDWAAAA